MKESKENQKKRWKKEANQLKEDLNNREKIVKKQTVELKLATSPTKKPKSNSPKNNPQSDSYLRKQLGL